MTSSASHLLLTVFFTVLRSHGCAALRLPSQDAETFESKMISCEVLDLFEYVNFKHYKRSVHDFSMDKLYGREQHLHDRTWAPAAWKSTNSREDWIPTMGYTESKPVFNPLSFNKETFDITDNKNDTNGFNQFLLEPVMLSKWEGICCNARKGTCTGEENTLIVPSPILHRLEKRGYDWAELEGDKDLDHQMRVYWHTIYSKFYKHAEHKPIIVMHMSFVFDFYNTVQVLQALSDYPEDFRKHIIIGGLEANLRAKDEKILSGKLPTLVALPYPVAIFKTGKFTSEDGSGYDPNRKRPILISFEGSWDQNRDGGNVIRAFVKAEFEMYTNVTQIYPSPKKNEHLSGVHLCRDPKAANDETHTCGLDNSQVESIYERSLNSVFCLEPAGDTLTRSHLYVAVQTGCVPVIFDYGHTKYSDTKTQWAWRKTKADQSSQFVNYEDFAVVYNHDHPDRVAKFMQELTNMPEKNPDRLLKLRKGLDKIAPLMSYTFPSEDEEDTKDAFQGFVAEVTELRAHRQ